jgi:hypothetical protein
MRRASSFGSLDRQIAASGHDDHTVADKWRDRELPPNITREIMKMLSGETVPETAVMGHYRFINSSVLVSGGRGSRLSLPPPQPSCLSMSARRKTWRRRILKPGLIAFNSGGTISCTVRDVSVAGACLEVANPIPDDFTLVIESDQIQRRCHVAWRRAKRIGVAFD